MSSATRLTKLIARFSSQYPSSNTSHLRHHGLSPKSGNWCLSNYTRMQINNTQKSGGVQPQPSSPLPPSSYLKWILGLVASIVVPSTSGTWGPFLQFKNDVDAVVETIEEIVEVVEKVAEIVDKVAEEISEDMPEGRKLKKVVDHLEDVAEATAHDARTVGDAIDKFQEVEGKIEGIMGINDEAN
ncbi:hypothetical protein AAHA92_20686 [Salvia divinorum]|uniref:Uncharacterized protein n=1 Tax=Salvia divinorum TaxID=28513 RepID=A0ABD1GHY7_SALDI